MGANERGVWVGLTNRWAGMEDRSLRSRGLLCRDLLGVDSAADAVAWLESSTEPYNPFHVLVADFERMFLVEHDVDGTRARELQPGCHLVTNRPYDETPAEPKAERVWRLLCDRGLWPIEPGSPAPADLEARLIVVLGDHGERGADAICLHGGSHGTKSAAVWRVAPSADAGDPARVSVAFAEGAPCSSPFSPFG
jgi:hypothetical protein